jgi:hypothetical protein
MAASADDGNSVKSPSSDQHSNGQAGERGADETEDNLRLPDSCADNAHE